MSREQGQQLLRAHQERLHPLQAQGFFAHGSLALGGYHHGISDLDLVVLLDHPLTPPERALVDASHRRAGPLLSAAYVLDVSDPEHRHPTWTHGWDGERRISLITRAELHLAHPGDWPEIPDIAGVVAEEVRRVWSRERLTTYLRTEYVDLALTSLARAHLTRRTGVLTGKDDAIARLPELGVPARLATAVADRRQAREALGHNRISRAVATRRTVKRLLDEL